MNCTNVRDKLALLIYGDLLATERTELETHLAACAECRRECRVLTEVRQLLGAFPAPDVRVDLPRLYTQAAERELRRVRRWRRTAILVGGMAALFAFFAFGPRFEARVEGRQLVMSWGAPSAK